MVYRLSRQNTTAMTSRWRLNVNVVRKIRAEQFPDAGLGPRRICTFECVGLLGVR
jgi:hypothetical protein